MNSQYLCCGVDVEGMDIEGIYKEVAGETGVEVERLKEEMPEEYVRTIAGFLMDDGYRGKRLVREIARIYEKLVDESQRYGLSEGSLISDIRMNDGKMIIYAEPHNTEVAAYKKKNDLNGVRCI